MSSHTTHLGFIGTGKITSAVLEGLCRSDLSELVITVSPRNRERSEALAGAFDRVQRAESNQEVLDRSDWVFIAVRPGQTREVLQALRFRSDHTVVSFVPFLRLGDLAELAAPATCLCRAIPLPTVVHHRCPIPIFPAHKAVMDLFDHIGQSLAVQDEEQLHTLWTLTGLISPFYDLLGELSLWTQEHGVNQTPANRFIADMFEALCLAARQTDPIHFGTLADHAATPQGMNEQAAQEIRAAGSHQAYRDALDHLLTRFETP